MTRSFSARGWSLPETAAASTALKVLSQLGRSFLRCVDCFETTTLCNSQSRRRRLLGTVTVPTILECVLDAAEILSERSFRCGLCGEDWLPLASMTSRVRFLSRPPSRFGTKHEGEAALRDVVLLRTDEVDATIGDGCKVSPDAVLNPTFMLFCSLRYCCQTLVIPSVSRSSSYIALFVHNLCSLLERQVSWSDWDSDEREIQM
jgi:hypothetical protein